MSMGTAVNDTAGMDDRGRDGDAALARMFDLDPQDAGLLETYCREMLGEVGVDGAAFFRELREGKTVGEALGLPRAALELIYARAHRWFSIGRPDRAEPLFRALCASETGVADYWVGLGVCLRLRGELDGAALCFAAAARIRPDWAVPAFHAVELALHRDDVEAAAREIAQFDRLADAAIPARMAEEADKMRVAIGLRRTPPRSGG